MRGMTTTLRFGDWAAMQADAKPIRMEVFVQEQKVPADLEMDDRDAACLHAVAYDTAGRPLGTGRLTGISAGWRCGAARAAPASAAPSSKA
jgi:hypothetical protein